jgi:hypothetical protein
MLMAAAFVGVTIRVSRCFLSSVRVGFEDGVRGGPEFWNVSPPTETVDHAPLVFEFVFDDLGHDGDEIFDNGT